MVALCLTNYLNNVYMIFFFAEPECFCDFRHHTSVAHPALKVSQELNGGDVSQLYLPYYCHVKPFSLCRAVQFYSCFTLCTVLLVSHFFVFVPSEILILQAQIMHYFNLPDVRNETGIIHLVKLYFNQDKKLVFSPCREPHGVVVLPAPFFLTYYSSIPLYEEG